MGQVGRVACQWVGGAPALSAWPLSSTSSGLTSGLVLRVEAGELGAGAPSRALSPCLGQQQGVCLGMATARLPGTSCSPHLFFQLLLS